MLTTIVDLFDKIVPSVLLPLRFSRVWALSYWKGGLTGCTLEVFKEKVNIFLTKLFHVFYFLLRFPVGDPGKRRRKYNTWNKNKNLEAVNCLVKNFGISRII